MTRTDPPPEPVPTLDYATASTERPNELKYTIAVAFAVVVILLGGLSALSAFGFFIRSMHERTTADAQYARQNAAGMLACSVVFIVPGIWYGRIGLRGDGNRR